MTSEDPGEDQVLFTHREPWMISIESTPQAHDFSGKSTCSTAFHVGFNSEMWHVLSRDGMWDGKSGPKSWTSIEMHRSQALSVEQHEGSSPKQGDGNLKHLKH